MSYGIQIRDASNKLILDTNSITWSYIDSFVLEPIAAGSSVTKTYSGVTVRYFQDLVAQVSFLDSIPNNQEAYVATVSYVKTTASANFFGIARNYLTDVTITFSNPQSVATQRLSVVVVGQ